jgi:hypothetical protein
MRIQVGFTVIFYDKKSGYYNEKIMKCFDRIPFKQFHRLRVGDRIWVKISEDHEKDDMQMGYRLVKVTGICESENSPTVIRWRAKNLQGKVFTLKYLNRMNEVYKLTHRSKLEELLKDQPRF